MLALQVAIPPLWLASVWQNECADSSSKHFEVQPSLGAWHSRIHDTALALAEILHMPIPPTRMCSDELHLTLAIELIRQCHSSALLGPRKGRLPSNLLERAIDYMQAFIDKDIALETIAAEVGLSPYHFARMFKVSVGIPPHRYLSEIRIERARIRLATTDESITEIAVSLGYDSPSHFSAAFRARLGMTPSTFRRQFL